MATATPSGAHLTVVLDLAPFASGSRDVAICAALRACQRVVARVLALWLGEGTGLQWLFRFVDSRVPPHAFTRVADLMKASSARRAELHIKMHRRTVDCGLLPSVAQWTVPVSLTSWLWLSVLSTAPRRVNSWSLKSPVVLAMKLIEYDETPDPTIQLACTTLIGEGRQLAACHDRPSIVSAASFSSFCRLLSMLVDAGGGGEQAQRKPQGMGGAPQARHRGEGCMCSFSTQGVKKPSSAGA